MAQFGTWLTGHLGRPVTGETELKGKYDFRLDLCDPRSGRARTGWLSAGRWRRQLEQKKAMIEMLVIDHLEEVPTEN